MTWKYDEYKCEYKKCGRAISYFIAWYKHSSTWIGEKLYSGSGGYSDYKKAGGMYVCSKHFKIMRKRMIKEHKDFFLYCDWCGKVVQIDENWDGENYRKCCNGYYMKWLKGIIVCVNCGHPVAQWKDNWLHKTFFNICNDRKVQCPACECKDPVPRKGRQVLDICLITDKKIRSKEKCKGCYKHKHCFGIEWREDWDG